MIKKVFGILLLILFILTSCSIEYSILPQSTELDSSGTISQNENSKMDINNLSISLVRNEINPAYDHIMVTIENNSPYPFTWDPDCILYEKRNEEYILLNQTDKQSAVENSAMADQITGGQTVQRRIYLRKLFQNDYISPGEYRIVLLVNSNYSIPLDFKISEDYTPIDTGISIETEQIYHPEATYFRYTVFNHSQEILNITSDFQISRYEHDKWTRLQFSDRFWEKYYHSNTWSDPCDIDSSLERYFDMGLSQIVTENLLPGKYRIEKEIMFDWYFFEFEVTEQ
ncbi:MAG: hypothetical protein KH009_00810 [Clostridiales bacterium]|nr:hypothetical protein [Clostridiales bacterium]